MAAVEHNLEGDRDLLCVAPVSSCNNILLAASGFSDGPREALGRGPLCARGLNGEADDIPIWDIVAGLVLLDLRDFSCIGDVACLLIFQLCAFDRCGDCEVHDYEGTGQSVFCCEADVSFRDRVIHIIM